MTNDEIEARLWHLECALEDIDFTLQPDALLILRVHMRDAVAAALEEAAKVADERAEKRAKQVTVAGQAGDYAMESLAIARGSEAESIRDAIRALIPSTGTKE